MVAYKFGLLAKKESGALKPAPLRNIISAIKT